MSVPEPSSNPESRSGSAYTDSQELASACYHRAYVCEYRWSAWGASSRRLPAGRKAELAASVRGLGQVTVARLAERFDVSADTIRCDLDQLHSGRRLFAQVGGLERADWFVSDAAPCDDLGGGLRAAGVELVLPMVVESDDA